MHISLDLFPHTAFCILCIILVSPYSEDGKVHDPNRIDFLARYLDELKKAATVADIRGYFQWSLIDNFEWSKGYSERFGLIYIDYQTQQRILKDSAYWYKDYIKNNGEF